MCVPAPTCRLALKEATKLWPNRNRASDGICGDAKHQARKSDHNAGNAFDLTHDPANGVDCHSLAERLRLDPRAKYVIWNHRIGDSKGWRPYSGTNPHTKHVHVSILSGARNDTSAWFGGAITQASEGDDLTPDQQRLLQEVKNAVELLIHTEDDEERLINEKVLPRLDAIERRLDEIAKAGNDRPRNAGKP